MKKNCLRLLSLTVLAVAFTSISAFAADAGIQNPTSKQDDVNIALDGTEKVRVTYKNEKSGKEYLIMVQSDEETPNVDNLVYIDQKTADGTAFIVYPKEMKDRTTYHVYLSSNAEAGITTRKEVGTFTYSAGQSDYTLGDVDGDGKITSPDALSTLQMSVGKGTWTDSQRLAANADKDDKITSADALMILQASVGKINLQ